ncbi:MAG: hypothetical protein IPK82_23935 [Polyangiaceae bacterium]|nr:hypothetical protein [Polyangiaceae bacterium]
MITARLLLNRIRLRAKLRLFDNLLYAIGIFTKIWPMGFTWHPAVYSQAADALADAPPVDRPAVEHETPANEQSPIREYVRMVVQNARTLPPFDPTATHLPIYHLPICPFEAE